MEENHDIVIDDDEADLRKSLERARKIALNKAVPRGPQAIALLASSGELKPAVPVMPQQKNTVVVFTEFQDFVSGLRPPYEESRKRKGEDKGPKASVKEDKVEGGGRTKSTQDSCNDQLPANEKEKNIALVLRNSLTSIATSRQVYKEFNKFRPRPQLTKQNMQIQNAKKIITAESPGLARSPGCS
ncbi:hypothetical protein AgCh_002978 [Apium graveolens]